MRNLIIFENFNIKFGKLSKNVYEFNELSGNIYKVVFHGPHDDFDGIETGITYDLDFFTQEKDYKKLTGGGIPFTVSNLIFNDILKDFLKDKQIATICILPTEPNEETPRFDKKIFTKYHLYLRTLKQKFNLPGWKIIPVERKKLGEEEKVILLINKDDKFWKRNMSNMNYTLTKD